MDITGVKVSLVETGSSKLKAFANIVLDEVFVVKDLKIIEGRNGLFVAMPGTCAKDSCPRCGRKNPVRDFYCGGCGARMPQRDSRSCPKDDYHDVAHPITMKVRLELERKVLAAYEEMTASISGAAAVVDEGCGNVG